MDIKLQIPDHGEATVQVCGVLAGEGAEVVHHKQLVLIAEIVSDIGPSPQQSLIYVKEAF